MEQEQQSVSIIAALEIGLESTTDLMSEAPRRAQVELNARATIIRAAIDSAAAPQVVADERKGSPYPEYDRGFSNGWDACAAAPVQAQEPVSEAAQQNGGLVRAALVDLLALERHALTGCLNFEAQNDCRVRFARARKALSVPVQPVAVPDGWKLVPIKPTEKMICFGIEAYQGKCEESYAAMLSVAPAAPAAQGDAPAITFASGTVLEGVTVRRHMLLDAKELTDDQLTAALQGIYHSDFQDDSNGYDLAIARAAIAAKAAS